MQRIATFLALMILSPSGISLTRADETGSSMADAAQRFVASLDDAQKAKATFTFDSPERFNWHWIPKERKGLAFKVLKPEQTALAFGLLNTGLSTRGMIRATTIMSMEEILRVDEHGTGPVRDSELYFVSVFGNPSDAAEWGWRVEGHHLALNYTLRGGKVVSATPFMVGANPAVVRDGPRKGLRNLADIEGPTDALLKSLTKEQLGLAVVSGTAPDVTVTPNSAQPVATAPEGIAIDKLDPAQRETLLNLIRAYVANFPESISDDLLRQIARSESSLHFAWSGPADRSKPHSFRIQGPTLFIDFNDTQNNQNHIHTFYRSFVNDFGVSN